MSQGLIYKKMNLVMSDVGHVKKNQTNTVQGFKFRGIDQFINALYPALVSNGVFMTPRCVSESHELRTVVRNSGKESVDKHVTLLMEYDFFAEDGSKVTVGPIACEGIDSGDKATNKALSAGLKYALIQTFSIPTEDMPDGDSDSPVIAPKPQVTVASSIVSVVAPNLITPTVSDSVVVVKSGFKRNKKPVETTAEDTTKGNSGGLF